MGGAHAVAALAYGTETVAARGRDRRPGQPVRAGGQAPGLRRGRHRRLRRAERRARARLRRRRPRARRARPAAQAEHGDGHDRRAVTRRRRAARRARELLDRRRPRGRRACSMRRDARRRRWPSPRRFAPEHLQLVGAAAEASRRACARRAACSSAPASATAFGDYVAGSNHTLPTGGAARFASGLSLRHFRRRMSEVRIGAAAGALAGPGARGRRGRGLRRARGVDGGAYGRIDARDAARAEISRETKETDVRLTLGLDGTGAGERATGRRLPGPHARPRSRATAASTSTVSVDRRPADRRPPHRRGHRHRPRAGARPGAGRPRAASPLRARRRADGRGARGVRDRHLRPPVLRLRAPTCRRAGPAASTTSWPRSSSARCQRRAADAARRPSRRGPTPTT